MLSFEDWLPVLSPDLHESVRWLFSEGPDLIQTGNFERGLLCQFASPNETVEPLIVSAEECCLHWGAWRDEPLQGEGWQARNAAMRTVRKLKLIQRGELLRLEGYRKDGRRLLTMLEPQDRATKKTAESALNRTVPKVWITHWLEGKSEAPIGSYPF